MSEHGVPIAGGDLSRAPVLIVSVTAIGRAERPVRRSGGRPGDVLVVTGELGGQAAAGYAGRVTPRIEVGCALAAVATARIDLSDGIATDALHIARSSGVALKIDLDKLPTDEHTERLARELGIPAWQAAATAGEDYELCVCVPPRRLERVNQACQRANTPIAWVGRVVDGEPGVILRHEGRTLKGTGKQELTGYEHRW